MTMPSASAPSSSILTRERSFRLAPAGPRRRADPTTTKPDAIPSTRQTSAAAGPSTSVSRTASVGSAHLQRKEVAASASRNTRVSPPRSSPPSGSSVSETGRIKTSYSPTSSSPLSSASIGRATSSRLGAIPQRSYESFADFNTRRPTDPQASPSAHSHLSPSTSESFRVHSASVSRKSSVGTGTGSDREGGGHLDLKRLLSKPALPNHSGSSIISLPSDSEPSASASPASSRRLTTAQAQAHEILRQRTTTVTSTSSSAAAARQLREEASARHLREKASARSMSALAAVAPTSRPAPSTHRGSLTPPEREPASNSKVRTVLKRKPSARSGGSTPTVTAQTTSFSSNETSRGSASRQHARSSDTARPPQNAPASKRVVPGSVATVAVRGSLRADGPPTPTGLTPAGAVAHAYKQQEERREKLAEVSGWNDHQRTLHLQRSQSSLSSLSFAQLMPPSSSEDDKPSVVESAGSKKPGLLDEPSGGPYYTVFGSGSDRLVAAGGREDDWQLSFDAYYGCSGPQTTVTPAAATSPPPKSVSSLGSGAASGMKGLSRKMSGKLRKVAGTGRTGRDESPQVERKETAEGLGADKSWRRPFDGRMSVSQDRGNISLDVGRASSVDGFVKVEFKEKVSPTAASVPGDKLEPIRRPLKHEKSKSKDKEDEPSPSGSKLWKLMKRISTGGLRDKYQASHRASSPPPVPALPKDILPSRLTLDIQQAPSDELVGESGILLSRFMQSRSSMSGVRPSTAPSQRAPLRSETDPKSRPSTGNKTDPRPSTTTRSSSPMSSDIASTRFFQKTHSNRSSTTSYGEELPPLPGSSQGVVPVSKHILPPSELYRMDHDHDDSHPSTPVSMSRRKPARSRSVPDDPNFLTSPIEDRPSLPFPPRRIHQSHSVSAKASYSPPSPTIPAFTISGAVNNFPAPPALSLSMSEFGMASPSDSPRSAPPSRPRKSSRRSPPSGDSSPSPASTTKPSPVLPSVRTPILPSLSIDVFSRSRRSISTSSRSLPHQHHAAPVSPSPSSPSTFTSKSPLTFRDMESPRTALSEREKVAKWDDLLERSAKAGGTLHLGETGLMSDNLRFSVVSES
ncbi:hypothetical protein EIP91_008730 [Steccherinum ochraceum]|uniref:Uncharacterized protein n=1 Tax=Steccherinum ochraceum TaxID=92696 RepID=A0A4R0RY25_9APHY|nr:hypothetical protein EIP91_008730 [Steccherinum ochraceum]